MAPPTLGSSHPTPPTSPLPQHAWALADPSAPPHRLWVNQSRLGPGICILWRTPGNSLQRGLGSASVLGFLAPSEINCPTETPLKWVLSGMGVSESTQRAWQAPRLLGGRHHWTDWETGGVARKDVPSPDVGSEGPAWNAQPAPGAPPALGGPPSPSEKGRMSRGHRRGQLRGPRGPLPGSLSPVPC